MVAARRTQWNFALERAVEWAADLGVPLVVYEPLRLDYRWASDRLHRFVLDGMADTRAAFAGRRGVAYFPWVEPTPGAGNVDFEGFAKAVSELGCYWVLLNQPPDQPGARPPAAS